MKISISKKLIVINLVIMLPLLIVSCYSYYNMVQATRHEASWKIRLIAEEISKDLADHFDKTFNVIDALATNPLVKSMNPAVCDPLFAKLLPSYPLHLNILAARNDGFNVGSAIPSPDVHKLNYLDKEWFQDSSRGKRFIGNLHISKLFKGPAIMIAGPVYGDNAVQIGVIGFPLNLDSLRQKLLREWRLPAQSIILIADGKGTLLVDTLHKEHVTADFSESQIIKTARKTVDNIIEMPAADGINRLNYVTTPAGTDWRIIVGVPTVSLASNALLINGRYIIAILVAIILGLSISFVIWHRISNNIVKIINGIKAIGAGQLDYRIKLRGHDELAEIENAFNAMAKNHQKYEQEIKDMNTILEQRVEERTAQLVAANTELDSFSYSISHDLQAPLRAIAGFSNILCVDYGDQLDTNAKKALERIQSGCVRMKALIADLLQLSRISRTELHRQICNLSDIAQQTAEEMQQSQPERQVEFQISSDITAYADPVLMRSVMENLLGNAWKFTRNAEKPLIVFAAKEENGDMIYYIKDNGAGFDQTYVDKLFTPFQRLHSNTEFEGTGIGLATVKRIIHRHGGKIWADGKTEEGATLYFTLPVNG